MKVKVAKEAGYCYGVERALKLAQEAVGKLPEPICTLGPIIHNPQVVDWLKGKGIVSVDSLNQIDKGTIIIRSHGVDPKVKIEAKKKGLEIIDATCPFVKKAQHCARKLIEEGYNLVIVGERNHPEVIGIFAYAGGKAVVVENVKDIKQLSNFKKVGIVVQTTQPIENLKKVINALIPKTEEIKIFNTICDATVKRQIAARNLAQDADLMLVVGGKNSANTSRLTQICAEVNPKTYHIETASEIKKEWFKGVNFVGITAGASTPNWIIDNVAKVVKKL
ncbi:4-hydroxy-3-methylbut-2-enyl diphosphate reductase [Candidatus Oleimmundimicrobium sp.]|uniref:4-hydroxy-3-methylbut-2-enyl diphosphate reductase n=1 Tax=Candidatus Oleimmundimicrobium sp. TaxID=3060597 RepID=UPI0027291E37|nr:4-hydroxy-3-methylbut-2-enyl diphosphate reductase [Candidatus Oleimmundimicrobium sp.]MDO8885303.1 4-hydroxy-3-methylbut-2-enyl diphosphate reductase [Candidatus Oleimmundimicrobium sp.]